MEMIDVLLVKPGKHPALVNIPYSLESLQGMVGGWIQEICPFEDPVALIVNDEGKMFHLPLNRALFDEEGKVYDILAGDMLVVGVKGEEFCSLTPELADKYRERFFQPEIFVQMGRSFLAVPVSEFDARANNKVVSISFQEER